MTQAFRPVLSQIRRFVRDEIYLIPMFSYRTSGNGMDYRYFVSRHRLQRADSPWRLIDGSLASAFAWSQKSQALASKKALALHI